MNKDTETAFIVGSIVVVVAVLFALNHSAQTKAAPITLVPQQTVDAAVATANATAAQAAAQNAQAALAASNTNANPNPNTALFSELSTLAGGVLGGAVNQYGS